MPYERSAGAVIFHNNNGRIEYLLLQYRHRHWDFPRGHVEPGETDEMTAQREIKEETSLQDLSFVSGFKSQTHWFYKHKDLTQANYKEAIYFLAQSQIKKVVLNDENLDFKWLTIDQALELPMFQNVKNVLNEAHEYLSKVILNK